MRDKDKAAELLREKGFDTENIDGVVITRFPAGMDKEWYTEQISVVENYLKEIGYDASKGYHIVNKDKVKSDD